jgi:hypothetical protein
VYSARRRRRRRRRRTRRGPGHSAGTIFIIINVLVLDTQRSNR